MKKICLSVLFAIATLGVFAQQTVTFTPTTVGWYRLTTGTHHQGGTVQIYADYDNTITDLEFQYNIGGYNVGGSIQQTRYSSYNMGAVDQVRISSDQAGDSYLDIHISTATSPGPVQVKGFGMQMPPFVSSPVVGAVAGTGTPRTLTLSHGFNSTAGATFAQTEGNVGIGLIAGTEKLEVDGNIRIPNNSGFSFMKKGDYVQPLFQTSRTDNTYIGQLRSNGWGDFSFNNSLGIGYDLSVSGPGYGQGNLLVSNNVGIGRAEADNRLSIYTGAANGGFGQGMSVVSGNGTFTTGAGGMLQFQNEDVITGGIRGVREAGWGSALTFYTHGATSNNNFGSNFLERMRIDYDGNVGIGGRSTGAKLDVFGFINTNSYVTSNQGFYMENTMNGINSNIGSGNLAFRTNNVDNRMVIAADGNVAIGATYSPYKLGVSGQFAIQTADFDVPTHTGSSLVLTMKQTTGNTYSVIQGQTSANSVAGDIAINPYGGNISVGTLQNDAKLTVNGTIHAQETRVDLAIPAPDYVFADDYKLQPLAKVADYIKQNKHLSDIPSAKTMEKDGVKLGEMNMLLLKKVEELTLYLLEKDKELQQQKKTDELQQQILTKQQARLDDLQQQLKVFAKEVIR